MSTIEEIQTAIEKLTEFKARGYSVDNGWLVECDETIRWPDDPRMPLTNDEYMVTLHRTIDAQLALLNEGATIAAYLVSPDEDVEIVNFVALARAINGGA
jgi:hypothetical protein